MNTEIIGKYRNQPLGGTTYNGVNYFVEDYMDIEKLSHILAEIFTSESFLNEKGLSFLKDYYGFVHLANLLEKNGGIEGDLADKKSILQWLETLHQEIS